MSDQHALYQAIILDHYRQPRNYRMIVGGRTVEAHNPLCGDRFTLWLAAEGGTVRDLSFEGSGCAVSVASASLMTETLPGLSTMDAEALIDRVLIGLTADEVHPLDSLGPLAALTGVRRYPTRFQCAVLPWKAIRAVLAGEGKWVNG